MGKNCKYKRSDAWLYVQNRMSREEEAEFQLHLLHCDECREELVRFRQMIRSIGVKERRGISFLGWMLAASVACILMGGGAYWYYGSTLREESLLPDIKHGLELNPPPLRNGWDSIAGRDSIAADTLQIPIIDLP